MKTTLETRANLAGRTALVLGGAVGIGRAVALALAENGIDLILGDIDEPGLAETASAVRSLGCTAHALRCDVESSDDVDRLYDMAEANSTALHIVINVAGGVRRGKLLDRAEQDDAADIRRNYGYVVQSYRRAIPLIRRSGRGGSIISFTTIEAHRGAAGFSVYAGAKAATTNFTRSMAVELAAERIRCNCVVPDTTPSGGNLRALEPDVVERAGRLPPGVRAKGYEMYIPMKRPPAVDDLANAVLFLASDLSAAITGTSIHVDGGTWAASGFIDWPHGDGHLPAPLSGSLGALFGER